MRPDRTGDRGAAVIELAFVFGLLLMISIGTFEYGMAFRDWHSVTDSAREGARVGASAGTFPNSDCIILEAVAGALQSLGSGGIDEIHIFKSDSTGSYPGQGSDYTRRYRPGLSGEPGLIACSGSSQWYPIHLGAGWDPGLRDNTGDDADWIGVRVAFHHDWETGLLWWHGSTNFADDAVFRLEPPPPG